jgi:hypothetical protein
MEALNLTLAAGRGIANAGPECPRRLIQQLLLIITGINLVRVDFVALRPVRRDQLVCQLIPDCGDTDSSAAPFALELGAYIPLDHRTSLQWMPVGRHAA